MNVIPDYMAEVFDFLSILIITALYISTIVLLYECVDLFFEAFYLIIHAVTERRARFYRNLQRQEERRRNTSIP